MANPITDDLGNRYFTGGRNPKPKKKAEPKEPVVTYTELDEAHWRIQRIWGRQDA